MIKTEIEILVELKQLINSKLTCEQAKKEIEIDLHTQDKVAVFKQMLQEFSNKVSHPLIKREKYSYAYITPDILKKVEVNK